MQTDLTHWIIVMGDFNVILGQKQESDKVYIEKFEIDQRNKRGDMLLNVMNVYKSYAMNYFI